MAVCRHGPILKSKAKKKEILGSPFPSLSPMKRQLLERQEVGVI